MVCELELDQELLVLPRSLQQANRYPSDEETRIKPDAADAISMDAAS